MLDAGRAIFFENILNDKGAQLVTKCTPIKPLNTAKVKESFEIAHIRQHDLLHCFWRGEFKDRARAESYCMQMVEEVRRLKVKKLINDNRQQIGQWPDMGTWLQDVWFPAISESGLRYFAHLLSPDAKARTTPDSIFNKTHLGVCYVTFFSYESAFNWLHTIDPSKEGNC